MGEEEIQLVQNCQHFGSRYIVQSQQVRSGIYRAFTVSDGDGTQLLALRYRSLHRFDIQRNFLLEVFNGQVAGQQDFLVTAYVPDIVLEACRKNGTAEIVEPEEKPEGLFASPAIFSELRAALGNLDFGHFDPEEVPVAVELSRQPLSPADKTYIDKVLGEGPLEVQMLGFAKSTIRQTSVKGLWRSKILSKAGKVLLDEVVAAPIPPEVPSTEDELPEAVKKLSDLIEWVGLDLSRGAIA